jgi:hypothetical protein
MGAVTLREQRQSLTIDSPEAVADLCSEMRFLDRNPCALFCSTPSNISLRSARSAKAA